MHNHTFGSILNKLGACPVQPNFVLVYVMEFELDLEMLSVDVWGCSQSVIHFWIMIWSIYGFRFLSQFNSYKCTDIMKFAYGIRIFQHVGHCYSSDRPF